MFASNLTFSILCVTEGHRNREVSNELYGAGPESA